QLCARAPVEQGEAFPSAQRPNLWETVSRGHVSRRERLYQKGEDDRQESLIGGIRIRVEAVERAHLLADAEEHLQPLEPLPQLEEERQLLHPGIGRDDHPHNLPTLPPQVAPQRVLAVAP